MKFVKSILLCICMAAVFMPQLAVNADAAGNAATASQVMLEDKSTYPVDLVDRDREDGKTVIYTRNYGEYTKPFGDNTCEFIVVNNIVAYQNTNGARGTYIPSNGYVISYSGNDNGLAGKLYVGEALALSNIYIPVLPDMYFKVDGIIVPIDLINSSRGSGQTILYNPSFGTATKTNGWGMELTVVNKTVTAVKDITNVNGTPLDNSSAIPENGMVVSVHSGNPYYKQLHEKVKIGDSIEVYSDNVKPYSAGKAAFNAYNPRSIEDNPSAWDSSNNKPYDGFRGPNQLIIYDSSYGGHTGTNAYGYEVIVDGNGKIIKMGGNDSTIPYGGFVLSGHGDMGKWLQKYALIGTTVVLDKANKEVVFVFTPASYIDIAEISIKTAQDGLETARKQYRDIPYGEILSRIYTAQAKTDKLKEKVNQEQYKDLANMVTDISNDAGTAYFMTLESKRVENRAVWLRPLETSAEGIKKQLDMLKALNINTIYLETYWGGYSIYPSDNTVMPLNPMYKGLDVLGTYVNEAHSRGIQVHAWVEDFLGGPLVAVKNPDWLVVSRKGTYYYQENGTTKYYFMNPALPKVRDFVSGLYKELTKKYDIDGIQFDYMRYPNSGDHTDDFSYDPYTRRLFKNYTGTDPITLKPGDPQWQSWCDFRKDIISSFVYRTVSEIKSIKPDIEISADVWPQYDKTITDIYQDSRSWTQKGYINNLVPMSYYLNEGPVVDDIMNTLAFAKGHSQVTSGIATYTGVDKNVFLRQIDAVRGTDTNGISIFEFQTLTNGVYDAALKLGAFSSPAVATNKDPEQAAGLVLDDIIRKIDDIYVVYGGMNDQQAEKYKKLVGDLKDGFADAFHGVYRAQQAIQSIEALKNTVNNDFELNREVAARISSDLNRAANIIDGYVTSSSFMISHEVRAFQAELSMDTLESRKEAPIKVKAIYNDGAVMYLDSTQYAVSSDNPASVAVAGDKLVMAGENGSATITMQILDTFKFNAAAGVDKKIELTIDPASADADEQPASASLEAPEVTNNYVRLYWKSKIADPAIVGYDVYRNDTKIATVSSDTFVDKELEPGTAYTYEIRGFDILGNVIYKSDVIDITTMSY